MLLLCLCGVIAGADSFSGIVNYGEEKLDFLRTLLPYKQGIPAHDTLNDLFRALDPKAFENCFTAWVRDLSGAIPGVVAIDGKSLRGSGAGRSDMVHLVSAYAHAAGLILGGVAVDHKTNEIKAIPEVLKMLELQGAIVTIDAMGCQKDIADAIIKKGADYLLALKGNQGTLHQDVVDFFKDPVLSAACKTATSQDVGHGRIEKRTARVACADPLKSLHLDWKNLSVYPQRK